MAEEMSVKKTSIQYPGNSKYIKPKADEEQEPEKDIPRVVTGKVIQRKKPLARKIVENFTGDDIGSVGQYILMDVMLPAAKSMISDAMSQGIERLLFGDSRPRAGTTRVGGGSFTSYNRMYSGNARVENNSPRTLSHKARANHDFGEVILQSRGEAEEVLDTLVATVEKYSVATVSDLYQTVGITGSFTDDKWGWTDLRGSAVRRVSNGYLIELPAPTPID